MPIDRAALQHLLDARAALVHEIDRLTMARTELDSVIARVSAAGAVSATSSGQPVIGARGTGSTGRARRPRDQRPARRTTPPGEGQKSIRIHVLEMLGAEDRDFGMAEIIDRIHAQGIQAHDDAVRSITIKLMKDGTVVRVGRGQYRLAQRAGAVTPAADTTPPAATLPATDVARALNLAQPWNRPES